MSGNGKSVVLALLLACAGAFSARAQVATFIEYESIAPDSVAIMNKVATMSYYSIEDTSQHTFQKISKLGITYYSANYINGNVALCSHISKCQDSYLAIDSYFSETGTRLIGLKKKSYDLKFRPTNYSVDEYDADGAIANSTNVVYTYDIKTGRLIKEKVSEKEGNTEKLREVIHHYKNGKSDSISLRYRTLYKGNTLKGHAEAYRIRYWEVNGKKKISEVIFYRILSGAVPEVYRFKYVSGDSLVDIYWHLDVNAGEQRRFYAAHYHLSDIIEDEKLNGSKWVPFMHLHITNDEERLEKTYSASIIAIPLYNDQPFILSGAYRGVMVKTLFPGGKVKSMVENFSHLEKGKEVDDPVRYTHYDHRGLVTKSSSVVVSYTYYD